MDIKVKSKWKQMYGKININKKGTDKKNRMDAKKCDG